MAQMTLMPVTRAIVLASALAAALIELYLATTPLYPFVFWFSIVAAIGVFAIGARAHTAGLPIALIAMYLMPAVYLLWIGRGGEHFGLEIIWILPLIGLIAGGRSALTWSLPRAWQWPLITWALVVAVSWPIIFVRELDFSPWILPLNRISNSSQGIAPWQANLTVTYFALGHLVGLLWIDALFRWFRPASANIFTARVAWPLAGAATIASLVAIYQGFVDLSFLNTGFWTYMLRASGTLGDPNKLGMIAAFWAIGSVALGRTLASPWSWVVSLGGFFIALTGLWTTGTRTGLAAVMIAIVFLAVEAVRDWRSRGAAASIKTPALIGVVIAAGLVLALTQANTHTVIGRGVLTLLPYGEVGVVKGLNNLLWERDGYGPTAIQMVREYPVSGVGIGTFHTLVHDYGTLLGYDIVPDNAQNWFRHLFAELGLSGSVAWIWWCVLFAGLVFRKPSGDDTFLAGTLRGAIVGFAIASMFGMAGQSMPVIVTFWVFVYWFAAASGVESGPSDAVWPRRAVILSALLIVVHVAGTLVAADDLRPARRAQRFGWPYGYGLMQLEPDPNGGPGRRWTLEESVSVIEVKGKVLKFAAWIDHPDADERPVAVRVWADSKLVYDGDLKRTTPILLDIPAAPGQERMLIETRIGRLWRPSDYGRGDTRELGLSIRDWIWD